MIQRELKEIEENTYAVTVKHISSKQIQKIKIPLPPLEIQEQIVAELDLLQRREADKLTFYDPDPA
jgi:type I restriction enzyme S subunit